MSKFGDDLIQALNEALAHAKGDGAAIVQSPIARKKVSSEINFQVKAKRGTDQNERALLGRNLPRRGRREGRLE